MNVEKKKQLLTAIVKKLQRASNLNGNCTLTSDESTVVIELLTSRVELLQEMKKEKSK